MPFGVALKPVANRRLAPVAPAVQSHLASAEEFNRRCPRFSQKSRVYFKIMEYHTCVDASLRPQILADIIQLLAPHRSDSVVMLYYAQALKDRPKEEIARERWGKVRSLLVGPQRAVPGPTLHLGTAHKNGGPTCEHNYWLEAMDPAHRGLGLLKHQIFQKWLEDTSSSMSFFDWLDREDRLGNATHTLRAIGKVAYYDDKERWKYMVFVTKTKKLAQFCDPMPPQVAEDVEHENAYLNVLSTKQWSTVFSGEGFGVWVLSGTGFFYSSKHVAGKHHHSSFLHGKPCKGAGEWAVTDGTLVYITHKTGHYRAQIANLVTALRELKQRTDISKTVACASDFEKDVHTLVMADELLTKGDPAKCTSLNATLASKAKVTGTTYNKAWLEKIHGWITNQMRMSMTKLV